MTKSLPFLTQTKPLKTDVESFINWIRHKKLIPFGAGDTTAGMEYELQVSVEGTSDKVDLPITIRQSNYFRNIIKRSERGDCNEKIVNDLKKFLGNEETKVWENSWVRLKQEDLCQYAHKTLEHDLLENKKYPDGPLRSDKHRFFVNYRGEEWLRLPISYILKLALADSIGREPHLPRNILEKAQKLQDHFLSDNTSPEILSLTISNSVTDSIGANGARESARTFLFTQLLIQYSNTSFRLMENGQRALLYFSPVAAQRQKQVNELVPDSFYRQLFMSPCLSGWDKGEEKSRYMSLCHRTLSRSQLNTIAKLREAGIISNNLIVLPNTSTTCLANNGTHVSLGSNILTAAATDHSTGFTTQVEKYYGDLVIKIVEHFLPLFINTSTAAPYRIDYADFHPEKVLGFLPHELDYTHLRMLWRRWKKKASIRVLGKPLTPFGPHRFDRLLASMLRTKGDLVPDFRLIDYLVALLSTETSPALNGIHGNQQNLMHDLAEMGIFDQRMSIYLPYRLREFNKKGYSGFEGRSYSLFPDLLSDMRNAIDLQNFITALAYQYVLHGKIKHEDIPDTPDCESERRQLFFATAIGIPTVYIDRKSTNRFLIKILGLVDKQRNSRRYKGYTRIHIKQYQLALLKMIEQDGQDLLHNLSAQECFDILKEQILNDRNSASSRLTYTILESAGEKRSPLGVPASRFNQASEDYYRNELRRDHLMQGLSALLEDCRKPEISNDETVRHLCQEFDIKVSPTDFILQHTDKVLNESLSPQKLRQLIMLCVAVMDLLENKGQR